jgi:predicted aldo/keto reductase-like oxidoreductase
MQRRLLGKTGLEVSVIGFGGIPIQKLPLREARILVNEILDAGINFFDTAQGYGDSEAKIGEGIKKRRKECILATKSPCRTAEQAVSHVKKALRRLKTDHIDLYQIHHVSKLYELEEILAPGGALEGLIKSKKKDEIKHIGITGHNPDLLHKALEQSDELETVQFPFNIIEDGENERALLEIAKKLQVGTIIMKPLAGGVIPEPELSFHWILQQGVDTVIPGMILSTEVKINAAVGDKPRPLSPQELSQLKAKVEPLEENFCRRCMYCMPCPEEIPIYLIQELGDKVKVAAVKDMCQKIYAGLEKTVEDCTECGECEEKCPYELPIREMLKEKHRLLIES